MKSRRILSAILTATMFLSGVVAFAQNSKKESIERYLIATGYVDNIQALGTIPAAFEKVTDVLLDQFKLTDVGPSSDIVDAYMRDGFLDDAVSLFVPHLQGISMKELNAVSKMLESPKGKIANEHSQMLNDPKVTMSILSMVQDDVVAIARGEEPGRIESGASNKRKKLFKSYFETSSMADLFKAVFDASFTQGGDQKLDPKVAARISQYFSDNMEEMYLVMSDDIMTDADFAFFDKLFNKTAYSKIIDGMKEVISDPEAMGMSLITNYATWFASYLGLE